MAKTGHRFLPGESGNPSGGSDKIRKRRAVAEWVDEVSKQEIPLPLLERLRDTAGEFAELIPEGATFGFAIALRLNMIALGGKTGEALSAIGYLQRNDIPIELDPEGLSPPKLPATEERRKAIASQLGVPDDEPIH